MRLLVVSGLLLWALAACSSQSQAPATSPNDRQADRAALNQLRAEAAAALSSGNAQAVGNFYAVDATVMPPGEPAVDGRAAIQAYFKAIFDQFTVKATLTSQEFTFVGPDWAFDRGVYTMTTTPKAGGNSTSEENKYITLLHREPDGWKAKRDIYNSNKPGS